jgi:cob(I)alamin adenosyltransferase
MSIATKRGDGGQTSLAGGARVSKAELRVETYGTVDELISSIGFARAICEDAGIREMSKQIQRELFLVGSALATPESSAKPAPAVGDELVEALTAKVHEIESIEGLIADWSVPGEHAAAAAFDVARTVCRRAERLVVRLAESGQQVQPNAVRYLNRLSDLLWLFGRKLETDAGLDSRLRGPEDKSPRWSRAW